MISMQNDSRVERHDGTEYRSEQIEKARNLRALRFVALSRVSVS